MATGRSGAARFMPRYPSRDYRWYDGHNIPERECFPAVLNIYPVRERCVRQHVIRNSRELGKVVRQRRKTLALTQAALAAVAGVGVRFVSELERGKQTAEFQRVLNVLHVLGMDLEVVARAEADA